MKNTNTRNQNMHFLKDVKEFKDVSLNTLEKLAAAADEVEVSQGQTILREGVIETHAFVVLQGAVRLLAKEPFQKELFTVGKATNGQLIGVAGLMRQSPCEGAIARRDTTLLSLPLDLVLTLLEEDEGLLAGLQNHWSPCEAASILGSYLEKIPRHPKSQKNGF